MFPLSVGMISFDNDTILMLDVCVCVCASLRHNVILSSQLLYMPSYLCLNKLPQKSKLLLCTDKAYDVKMCSSRVRLR